MSDVADKRVYGDAAGDRTAFVAGGQGVVAVRVSAGDVGRFGLVSDRPARDVAAAPPGAASPAEAAWPPVAVAAAGDVRVGDADGLAATGFGPAVAVGFDGDALLAAGPDGRVARAEPPDGEWPHGGDSSEPDDAPVAWTDLGDAGDVRAVDGPLVATADGVVRVAGDDLTPAGLADVRDVAAAGPLAATGDGLYRLANGWQAVRDGVVRFVTAAVDGRRRAHAGTDGAVWSRRDGEWTAVDLPETVAGETVVDVGYGVATYAVTDEGTLLVAGGGTVGGDQEGPAGEREAVGDWRTHPLGVRDVVALAVAGGDGRS